MTVLQNLLKDLTPEEIGVIIKRSATTGRRLKGGQEPKGSDLIAFEKHFKIPGKQLLQEYKGK